MSIPFLFGLSFALHLYIGVRVIPAYPSHLAAALLALLLVASAAFVPTGLLARRLAREGVAQILSSDLARARATARARRARRASRAR